MSLTSFQLGELILCSKPYAYVLNNVCRGQRCDYCFKKQDDLKRCSQCSFLYFCNKNCQSKAWDTHKAECKLLMKAKPKEPTAALRLVSLILFNIKKYGLDEPYEDVYGRRISYRTLMSHAEEIKQSIKPCQQMIALMGTLKDYIGQANIPSPSEFIELFGKMSINTFSICDNEMQSIGSGLYLGASVFDHSCQPDAEVVFDGVNLCVRATRNLPHRDISQIYISYIEQLQLTVDRQEALKEQYYFCCQCERCSSSYLDDMMRKSLVNEKDAEVQMAEFNKKLKHLKQMKKDRAGSSTIYEACMKELENQDKVFADSHICKVKTLELAFDACVQNNQWSDAVTLGKALLEPYRLYYDRYHPLLGLQLFKIGKIEHLLNLTSASAHLKEAESILKVTHGETHPLCQDLMKILFESEALSSSICIPKE